VRRRQFIAFLGSGAATWPFRSRAQQPAMPVIGFLRSASFEGAAHLVAAFRQGLQERGFIEGQNVVIDYRTADNDRIKLTDVVGNFIRRPVALIVGNTSAALAAKAATTTVPIVFATGGDPVGEGLVAAFHRPGGNVTGVAFFSAMLGGKRLELLRQLVQRLRQLQYSGARALQILWQINETCGRLRKSSARNSLFSKLLATATSKPALQCSPKAEPVHCLLSPVDSCSLTGNVSSRWLLAVSCQRSIVIANSQRRVD